MANIKIEPLNIKDAFIVRGRKFLDDRGFFEELYNESKFYKPITKSWKQVSLAESKTDVLRGLHCSNYAKFVTCVKGEVYDVIVDLRPNSPTYLQWTGVWLDADDNEPVHVYIPKRCGHGYYCKKDSLFLYLQDGCYNPKEDIEVNLFDPKINIDWPKAFNKYIISDKDRNNKTFNEVKDLISSSVYDLYKPEIGHPLKDVILIYGGNGFLGSFLVEELVKTNKTFKVGLARLENRNELIDEIRKVSPSRIICLAGIAGKPNISWCDSHQVETIRANVIGQLNIADVANSFGIHCVLLTTGVIYNYDDAHPINSGKGFTEEDKPNYEGNFYSKARVLEEELLKSYPNVLNLRISYPTVGSLHPNSFVSKLIKYNKIQSVPLSLTVVDDLWPVMLDMSDKKVTGTFNFNNPGAISHDEILKLYKEMVDQSHAWELSEPNLKDRSAAELSANKLLQLGYKVPHVKDAVMSVIKKIKDELEHKSPVKTEQDVFTPKNILLTGGAGFIGSHVAIHLVKKYKNCNVVVYDILDYCANMKNLDEIKDEPNFKFVKGDICSFEMVQFVIKLYNIDTIMHFAAQSHVDVSIKNSLKFTEVNVLGTHVLLENARLNNIKRFVHVSTDEVYGSTDDAPNLDQALEPTNPYACSKLAAEIIIMAYRKCFKLPVIISRGNNVYGPHQFLEKVNLFLFFSILK